MLSDLSPVGAQKSGVSLPMAKPVKGRMLTQHTGLPPRVTGSAKSPGKPVRKAR